MGSVNWIIGEMLFFFLILRTNIYILHFVPTLDTLHTETKLDYSELSWSMVINGLWSYLIVKSSNKDYMDEHVTLHLIKDTPSGMWKFNPRKLEN